MFKIGLSLLLLLNTAQFISCSPLIHKQRGSIDLFTIKISDSINGTAINGAAIEFIGDNLLLSGAFNRKGYFTIADSIIKNCIYINISPYFYKHVWNIPYNTISGNDTTFILLK